MNKIILWIVIIIIIIGGLYFFLFSKPSPVVAPNISNNPEVVIPKTNTPNPVSTVNTETKKSYSVSIVNFAFSPNSLNINKGDTVIWTNNDGAPHKIAGDNINSSVMSKGQTFSQTFNIAGSINYYCSIHPAMKGVINVK